MKIKYLLFSLLVASNIKSSDYEYIKCKVKPIFRKSKNYFSNLPHSIPRLILKSSSNFSPNWAGYAALTNIANPTPYSVSKVVGSWIVPDVKRTKIDTHSAAWIGIDGFGSDTVEQIGTEQDFIKGKKVFYAWFEMYPEAAVQIIGFPVNPGDTISAAVEYIGNSTFVLSMTNHTRKKHVIVPTKYTKSSTAKRTSAEWIMEATFLNGVLPLANFGSIKFIDCAAKINDTFGTINNSDWKHIRINMGKMTGVTNALTSQLSCNGKNFTVVWKHQ